MGKNLIPRKVEAVSIDVLHRDRVLEGDPFVMEVDDNARVKFLLEDPATGAWTTIFMEASWCGGHIGPAHPQKNGAQGAGWVRIEGDAGEIFTTTYEEIKVTRWDGQERIVTRTPAEGMRSSFGDEIEIFIDCVREGRPPEIDVNYGAEIIAMVGAAYLSAIVKRAVTLDEFKDFSRGYVAKYGDNEQAAEAILGDLLAPYKLEKQS